MRPILRSTLLIALAFCAGVVTHRSLTADERAIAVALNHPDETFLDQRVTAIDWSNVTLTEAFDRLRVEHGLHIVPQWDEIWHSDVDRSRRFDLHLRGVTVGAVLDATLFLAEDESDRLGWYVDGKTVFVTTVDEVKRQEFVHVYDVRPILHILRKHASDFAFDMHGTVVPKPSGGLFGASSSVAVAQTPDPEEVLLDSVQCHVTADEWQINGGVAAAAQILGGRLFVRHHAAGHRKVAGLLELLVDDVHD